MRISLNWLGDHVDLRGLDARRIADELTLRTALIEGLTDQGAALKDLRVARVMECARHPSADRLSVCRVDHGAGQTVQVVCGAPNVAVGQWVVFAPVGSVLPDGTRLKQARIRGQVSEGMICAEDELGLGPEHDGILVLPGEWEAGRPFAEVPGWCDVVLEIDNKSITHRPDLWGHRGFAREIAAIFRRDLLPLVVAEDLQEGPHGPRIALEPGAGCDAYLGLAFEALTVRPTPDPMRFRLAACGMRPINPWVDLSNAIMLELGQPTHPFDRDALDGDEIVVRRAGDETRFVTLDGVERELVRDDLVIADGRRSVALAGIMGGAATEVGQGTRRILLESAVFDPAVVRRAASRLGLRTEAVARFEKHLDPSLSEVAIRRYAFLLRAVHPEARLEGGFRQAGRPAEVDRRFSVRPSLINSRLGLTMGSDQMVDALTRLGIHAKPDGSDSLDVRVPSWRATRDLRQPADIVEEVGRIVGYGEVPTARLEGPLLMGRRDDDLALEERLRDGWSGAAAATEVFSYATLSDQAFETLEMGTGPDHPRLANALQKDACRLRPSVAPGLLLRAEGWLRVEPEVRAFEIGRVWASGTGCGPAERSEAAIAVCRRRQGDARDLVRLVEGLLLAGLDLVGTGAIRSRPAAPRTHEPWMHPHRTAELLIDGRVIGRTSVVNGRQLLRLGVGGAEIGVGLLEVHELVAVPRPERVHRKQSRYPASRIDLAFTVPYSVPASAVVEEIWKAGPRTLVQVDPFDVYRKGRERSLAYRLTFQAPDRTLTDDDVASFRSRIVTALDALGVQLR